VGPIHSASGLNQINRAKTIQTNLNLNQTHPNFILSKHDFLGIKKFKIKYGCEGFEERNNFLHHNFFRFKMDFELKNWEFKVYF
jgi:hypothetical protein